MKADYWFERVEGLPEHPASPHSSDESDEERVPETDYKRLDKIKAMLFDLSKNN